MTGPTVSQIVTIIEDHVAESRWNIQRQLRCVFKGDADGAKECGIRARAHARTALNLTRDLLRSTR